MVRPAFLPAAAGGPRAANVNYLGAARSRRKFELYYPGGFFDEAYLLAERAQRERAHAHWQAELAPAHLRKLLARGEYRQIADAALRVEGATPYLSRFEKMALREALRSLAGARLFAHELYAFVWGRGTAKARFSDWVQALAELPQPKTRVTSWPVATAFGFLARPERHLLYKPRVTQAAARAYGFDLGRRPALDWAGYENLLTFAAIVQRDLARHPHLRARDLIDLQAFMWVQGAAEYDA